MSRRTSARTRRGVRGLAAGLGFALALTPVGAASAQSSDVTRVEPVRDSSVAYAVAWSQATFADSAAPTVLLARDDDFSDALASGVAQGVLQAPLLLTASNVLSPETALELQRLGAQRVVILGGEEAVGAPVETELEGLQFETERIGGETRLETAIMMAERFLPQATSAIVARARATEGEDPTRAFADALAVNAYSVQTMTPVLLTDTDALSDSTHAYLTSSPIEEVVVAGGTAAVSDQALAAIVAIDVAAKGPEAEMNVRRVAGPQRFATAIALSADLGYTTAADAPRVLLVEGQDANAWASGLPAGVQAGNGAALVLANGTAILAETQSYLASAAGGVPLVCGPGTTADACRAAATAMGLDPAPETEAPTVPLLNVPLTAPLTVPQLEEAA